MQRTPKVSVLLMLGLLIAGAAVFPDRLGLDTTWGKGRVATLMLGVLVGLWPWIPWKRSETQEGALQRDLFAFPALLVVVLTYVWFGSLSRGSTSSYYDLLATSFRQGELALSLRPDPALLALPDPYDPIARQGIKAPLDLSLYKGKFYLYWGPAPAVLLAMARPLLPGQVSDGFLLLAFVCGIFLVQSLLILRIWERFLRGLPKWIVILSILLAGLTLPTLWLLSQPKIYEAAIAGGQFFFIAGLCAAWSALDRPVPSGWRLALAGILWSLAVGTRSVLVFPVAFMACMIVSWSYGLHRRSLREFVMGLIPLGVPLMLGAIAFGWYNWVRFGSVAETGFSYALAGPDLQEHLHELFSPAYLFQNLYNYLINPFAVQGSFPFLSALRGRLAEVLPWRALPEIYSAQAVTGILWAAPFTIFAAVPIFLVLKQLFKRGKINPSEERSEMVPFHWLMTSLAGSSVVTFACLLGFFWAAMRYAEDFMPALILLGILGFWHGWQALSGNSNKGKMYIVPGLILAGLSILIATLLALSNYSASGLL